MIKAIVFDCFGVLYADPSQTFYESNVVNYEQLRTELLQLNAQSDRGFITRDQWIEQVSELTGLSIELVQDGIMRENIRNQPLVEYVTELRTKGYKVGLLSNVGAGGMDRFFSFDERQDLFDAVILSGEVGIAKPNPVIFEMMAERLGLRTGDCVMIDDAEVNCAGADAAGMQAIIYRTNDQVRQDLQSILEASS